MNQQIVNRNRNTIRAYLERRQLYPFQLRDVASEDLGAVVVIPCFDEPDICGTLDSLKDCRFPGCSVAILVVVNASEHAPAEALAANRASIRAIRDWCGRRRPAWLSCHVIEHQSMPERHAGVGLARKLGLDEGAGCLASNADGDGVLISLDADCRVDAAYLETLVAHFREHPECPGVSIDFEHPVDLEGDDPVHLAVAEYELHLRYYVAGLRYAGFPYAFHTVGSAMACRAVAYARQGGMNRRQGGEDFYFIQKLVASGGYRSVTATTVYPGVRRSSRVPFGTGPAVARALAGGGGQLTYAPEIFADLAVFCAGVPDLQSGSRPVTGRQYSPALEAYLDGTDFQQAIREIRNNVASPAAFHKRLFRWFNAFRFLKFAQFASGSFYPKPPVVDAAYRLMQQICVTGSGAVPAAGSNMPALLRWYRSGERLKLSHCQGSGSNRPAAFEFANNKVQRKSE